jgi:pimeloyl-ACP methyl ester carboxylesterase
MKAFHWGELLVGLLLVSISIWQIQAAVEGVDIITVRAAQPPLTVFQASGANSLGRPTVLIGHGFAGSGVIMRGFALTLAHAGFNVITWDFDGHGRNPDPLQSMTHREGLVINAEQALAEAARLGLVSREHIAILGHSMGSGVALAYGQIHPGTDATIGVSPVVREVTPELPRNLLLIAGTGEENFLNNARQLLARAGGESGDHQQGTARALVAIEGANHLSILFNAHSHLAVREWLEAVYGPQPGSIPYTDRRMAWFALGVLGTLVTAFALAQLISPRLERKPSASTLRRRLIALLAGVLGATLSLALLIGIGLEVSNLFGVLIGGYLMVWFAIAGILAMLIIGSWPGWPSIQSTLAGLLTFIALWLGIGLLGNTVWQPWLLILPRLVLWPLAAVLLLPWFLAVSELGRGAGWLGQSGAWLAHSVLLIGGLLLAIRLTPGIGFLTLLAPVFPAFFALHALASGPYRGSWPFALSGAMLTSWMLLAVFPLCATH